MTDDTKRPDAADGHASDEAFFARWSRRKRQAEPTVRSDVDPIAAKPPAAPVAKDAAQVNAEGGSPATTAEPIAAEPQPGPLTEADFDDVDFDALTYGSDYGRFMQAGVPESIRQKALSKLWHSDPIFTAVDPFQDYAGDYTDAAVVPKSGIVKTAYKVGQGFLSDDEAHAWHRLGKPTLPAEMAALPILVPGVRVRSATTSDSEAVLTVHRSASLETADTTHIDHPTLWPHVLTADGYARALAAGEVIEIAVDEETTSAVAVVATIDDTVTALFVHAQRARRGLGRAMLQRAVAAIRSRGHAEANLKADARARPFFEAQGFDARAETETTPRDGLTRDAVDMHKRLVAPSDLTISREPPDQPEVRAFFAASEAYMGKLYPAESNHFVGVETLTAPHVVFLVARSGGTALGCGAIVKSTDASSEIKRMWIAPHARGLDLGRRLLDALLNEARTEGLSMVRLETGIAQPEALGLYRRAGFVEIGPFGTYQADPLSLFMERAV